MRVDSRFEQLYLVLGGIFIAALVSCNLIFQKFFTWRPFDLYTFEISVGILPYPITFLCTDIISEIYGKRRADAVVKAGLVASVCVILFVLLADRVPQTSWSPVSNETFHQVFGLFGPAVFASMSSSASGGARNSMRPSGPTRSCSYVVRTPSGRPHDRYIVMLSPPAKRRIIAPVSTALNSDRYLGVIA